MVDLSAVLKIVFFFFFVVANIQTGELNVLKCDIVKHIFEESSDYLHSAVWNLHENPFSAFQTHTSGCGTISSNLCRNLSDDRCTAASSLNPPQSIWTRLQKEGSHPQWPSANTSGIMKAWFPSTERGRCQADEFNMKPRLKDGKTVRSGCVMS